MTTSSEDTPAYGSHADRLSFVADQAEARRKEISAALREAFSRFIEQRETEWIRFDRMTVDQLSSVLQGHPAVLKSVAAICNIAQRAIERDLGVLVDTYPRRLKKERADQLAGYLKPFLPAAIAIPAVELIDNYFFVDKELRAARGNWEKLITACLTRRSGKTYKKRMFRILDDETGDPIKYELDAACPAEGEPIDVGIDVKTISSPRDFHKRGDEIINKANKYKTMYPKGKFGAVLYYPYLDTQANVIQRLHNANIDGIVFAGDSSESVETAVLNLMGQLGLKILDETPPASLFSKVTGTQIS